jgi:hypothetical protein
MLSLSNIFPQPNVKRWPVIYNRRDVRMLDALRPAWRAADMFVLHDKPVWASLKFSCFNAQLNG